MGLKSFLADVDDTSTMPPDNGNDIQDFVEAPQQGDISDDDPKWGKRIGNNRKKVRKDVKKIRSKIAQASQRRNRR